jgi:DnaJ-domain-containing protein 1
MPINKELIIRIVVAFVFFGFVARILIPLIYDALKGKQLGLSKNDSDIDYLIKKEKEVLKSKYRISTSSPNTPQVKLNSPEIQKIKTELSWGGNDLQKEIKTKLNKDFSYAFGDNKIAAFLTLVEKRNYLSFIDIENEKIEKDQIINFLCVLFIMLNIVEEIKIKDLSFTNKCAQKIGIKGNELALAIQIKILASGNTKNIKSDRIYSDQLILSQFSEDSFRGAIEDIINLESRNWQKSISSFFEELTLFINYAQMLSPIKKPENKNDIETALIALGATAEDDFEIIKKKYKKLAQNYHPDKIIPKKLPGPLEKKAILKFNIIQEAYEIISERNK